MEAGEREVWVLARVQGASALVELVYVGSAEGAAARMAEGGEVFEVASESELDKVIWEIEGRYPEVRRVYLSRWSWMQRRSD